MLGVAGGVRIETYFVCCYIYINYGVYIYIDNEWDDNITHGRNWFDVFYS
jgi:hypothetical protein